MWLPLCRSGNGRRGIHASPDRKTIYVALSGSPIAGPDVDESTLPPPDKSADGIGVFDVAQNKLVKLIKSGSDPENFDLSRDGKLLYVSNEDAAGSQHPRYSGRESEGDARRQAKSPKA